MIVPSQNQNTFQKHNLNSRKCKNFDRENCLLDYFEIDWNSTIEVNKEDVNHSLSNLEISKKNAETGQSRSEIII